MNKKKGKLRFSTLKHKPVLPMSFAPGDKLVRKTVECQNSLEIDLR